MKGTLSEKIRETEKYDCGGRTSDIGKDNTTGA